MRYKDFAYLLIRYFKINSIPHDGKDHDPGPYVVGWFTPDHQYKELELWVGFIWPVAQGLGSIIHYPDISDPRFNMEEWIERLNKETWHSKPLDSYVKAYSIPGRRRKIEV